ncbi:MAG: M48 family metalloprotease [Coriobacteriia bacterium]|nr:M48 family metalloprotease [Coriobacteriia bacterium]
MTRPSGMTGHTLPPGVRAERIETLWQRVDGNRIRFVVFTSLFVTIVSLLISLVVAFGTAVVFIVAIAETEPEAVAALPALAGGSFALSMLATTIWVLYRLSRSERWLVKRLGARITAKGEFASAKSVFKDVTIAAGFKHSPPLYIIDSDRVNAFALGRTHSRAVVGITQGFVERLTADQQRAVFANLMARVVTLDTLWATAVSALMGPIWAMRERDLLREDAHLLVKADARTMPPLPTTHTSSAGGVAFAGIAVYGVAVVVTEVLSWWHQKAAWMAAEKADAEGMMLLKDPRSMLSALESVLDCNNHVTTAGDAFSQLFYCWAGFGFAPEDDPEYQRVAHLREVLGAEGLAQRPAPNLSGWACPPPPRLDDDETGAYGG